MAVDVALWFIFAAMIGLIACGCVLTRPRTTRPEVGQRDGFEHQLDRAA